MTDWTISLNNKIIKRFSVAEGETATIGRGKECSVIVDSTAISRQHVSIFQSSGISFVSDLGSTNGTFLNGKKVEKDEPVSEDDIISFGKFTLSMSAAVDEQAPTAASTAADTLDLDDETIFVGGARTSSEKKFRKKGSGPVLKVLQGGGEPSELAIGGKNSVKIGKDPGADIRIGGFLVAKAQCYIIKRDDAHFIVPQKVWAGTFVNDIKISEETRLRPGDIIKIRGNVIRFD